MRSWFDDGAPRALVIAEVAQAHDGSLGTAHAYIDAIADAGADAVKFQTHIAAAESTAREPWRVRFSPQDDTRFEYWRRMEFTEAQWVGLREHTEQRDLLFLSSPFSPEAVDLLERVDVPAWKVASGEISNHPLLDRMAETGKPLLFSSGMSAWEELDAAIEIARHHGVPFAVFQCTSAYPCPPEKVGLNVLAELRERYGCPVGISDHSGTPFPALGAAALGADLIEIHVTFSRDCFGPDVPASVTTKELADLVRGVRFLDRARRAPVLKDAIAEDYAGMRRTFGKSVVAARELRAGRVLEEDDLALKKPGTGLPPSALRKLLGGTLRRDVVADEELREEDVELG
jgi:N,N'-diacetyllegionaminate synthase